MFDSGAISLAATRHRTHRPVVASWLHMEVHDAPRITSTVRVVRCALDKGALLGGGSSRRLCQRAFGAQTVELRLNQAAATERLMSVDAISSVLPLVDLRARLPACPSRNRRAAAQAVA